MGSHFRFGLRVDIECGLEFRSWACEVVWQFGFEFQCGPGSIIEKLAGQGLRWLSSARFWVGILRVFEFSCWMLVSRFEFQYSNLKVQNVRLSLSIWVLRVWVYWIFEPEMKNIEFEWIVVSLSRLGFECRLHGWKEWCHKEGKIISDKIRNLYLNCSGSLYFTYKIVFVRKNSRNILSTRWIDCWNLNVSTILFRRLNADILRYIWQNKFKHILYPVYQNSCLDRLIFPSLKPLATYI